MRPEASPRDLLVLGLLSTLKALGLVLLAEGIARGIIAAISGLDVSTAALLIVAAGALRAGTSWATQVFATRAALSAKAALRGELADRVLAGGAGRTGALTSIGSVGLDELDTYYRSVLPALTAAATIPLLVGTRILFADWLSALIIVLTVPLVPVFMTLVGLHTRDRADAASAALARLSDHLVELARGLPVLVGLGRVDEQSVALRRISEQHRVTTMSTLRSAFLSSLVLEVIATLSVALVAVTVGIRLVHGDMTLELGLVALILAPECFAPFRDLGAAFHASQDGLAAKRRVREVVAVPVVRDVRVAPIVASGVASAGGGVAAGGLRVTGLTVQFEGRDIPAVDDVSFDVRAGSFVVLEGPSGSGKSTILKALAGDLDASASGVIAGIDPARVAWAPQHPHTVGATVAAELELYGATAADLASLGLAHLAAADPARLSPGELRRLAVARALARVRAGADILLLDEPTAHLDARSSDLVLDALRALRGRATVIVATHDAAVAELADHRVLLAPTGLRGGRAPVAVGDSSSLAPVSPIPPTEPEYALGAESFALRDHKAAPSALVAPDLAALARYLGPARGRFAAAIALGTAAALFAVALTALSGWLIVRASEQPPIMYLMVAIVGVRFFGLGRSALRYAERLLTHDAVLGSLTELRARLWSGLAARAVASRSLARGGVALDLMVASADRVRDLVPRVLLPTAVAVLASSAAVVTVALILSAAVVPMLALCAVALAVAPVAAVLGDRAAARGQAAVRSTAVRELAGVITSAGELRANGIASRARARLADLDNEAGMLARRTSTALGLGGAIVVFAACATAATLLTSVSGTGIAPALVAVLVLLPVALIEPLLGMVDAAQQASALRAGLRKVEAVAAEVPVARSGELILERVTRLELDGLAVGWPGAEPATSNLHASIGRGEWLVVEGPSGSGKSTLLATLLGYLEPAAGSVRINGADARDFTTDSVRSRIAWCPQESHLFDSTLRANLLLARPHNSRPSDRELVEVIHRVGLGQLLTQLPRGLDTRIGSEGASLSGGQRQRLAVARTLLADADVILLDEPTAHLDASAAESLLTDVRAALADRLVVLVTHHAEDVLPTDVRVQLGAAAAALHPAEVSTK